MRRASVAAVVGVFLGLGVSLALAQPKPVDPKFNNVNVTQTLNATFVDAGTVQGSKFVSTLSTGTVANGGYSFSCPGNPGVSSPCLANPNKPLELGGFHASTPQDQSSDVYLGCMENKDGGSCLEVLNNYGAPGGGAEQTLGKFTYNGDLRMYHWLYLNDAAGTDGRIITNGLLYNMAADTVIFWNQGSTNVAQWYTGAGGTLVGTLTAGGQLSLIAGNGTAGSGTGYTANETGAIRPFVHKITMTRAALDAAATSDETIWTFPAKTRIIRVIDDVTQTFSGGSITDMDVVCGPTAGTNTYLLTHDVDTATGTYGDVVAEIGSALLSATYADVSWTTGSVICRYTCVGGNCSTATQGSSTFYIEGVTYP